MYELGHDAKYFENPEKFDPERWLNADGTERVGETPQSSAWLPFGTGMRSCIGNRMAMMEGKIILCRLMQRYSVRYLGEVPIAVETNITVRPKFGLPMRLLRRSEASSH